MRRASCMIGNSSAGLLETAVLKLPSVNIGRRQDGRERAGNVRTVSNDPAAIRAAGTARCATGPGWDSWFRPTRSARRR